jgi:hypothetical protein
VDEFNYDDQQNIEPRAGPRKAEKALLPAVTSSWLRSVFQRLPLGFAIEAAEHDITRLLDAIIHITDKSVATILRWVDAYDHIRSELTRRSNARKFSKRQSAMAGLIAAYDAEVKLADELYGNNKIAHQAAVALALHNLQTLAWQNFAAHIDEKDNGQVEVRFEAAVPTSYEPKSKKRQK